MWIQNLLRNSPEGLAGKLASRHCAGTPVTAKRLSNGAFNVCYRVTFEDGHRVVVRFTALGRVIARNEKVEDEVAVMEYVAQHTSITIPQVFGSGRCAVGPYIVMSFIKGTQLSEYLKDPCQETTTLNPRIPMSTLRSAYFGMAEVLLELSKSEFFVYWSNQTGSLRWLDCAQTFNKNRLAQFSNIPHDIFERQHFSNAADYFGELAQQHFYHLELQRKDAVTDESDCRKKYIARCLFRKLSREISRERCNGPFRLYCDDLSPSNVLVDASKLAVTGVIAWEFAYAAPVEFTYATPWWLVLERPEDWECDLDQFLVHFMPRFTLFSKSFETVRLEKSKPDPCHRPSVCRL